MIVSVMLLVLGGAAFTSPEEQKRRISVDIVENPASLDALVATCTGILEWDEPADMLLRLPWGRPPAAAGREILRAVLTPAQVPLGFYPPGDPNTPSTASLANFLYRGGTVAWYAADGTPAPIQGLEALVNIVNEEGGTFVAVPWPPSQAGQMPVFSRTQSGKRILYMRWGIAQSCAVASDAVMNQIEQYDQPRGVMQ